MAMCITRTHAHPSFLSLYANFKIKTKNIKFSENIYKVMHYHKIACILKGADFCIGLCGLETGSVVETAMCTIHVSLMTSYLL